MAETRSLTKRDIGTVVSESMVDYAEQTILDRAIPDIRDGMKPVHRRILFGMNELNLWNSGKTLKSARIVGEVMGKYHPHGDMSVYGALVRMAQDFSLRCPLVQGQGNFGSIDGDGPAAMRYTEAKLSLVGEYMLSDIDRNTVDFMENFDGTLKEPMVLPTRIPNLLVNGSSGIAVGMSTSILPHNLNEVCAAILYIANRWNKRDKITVDDLMQIIPGPDLPTGGILYRFRRDEKEGAPVDMIRQAYETGYAKIICQATADFEKNGKTKIIIKEIPYQLAKSTVLERVVKIKDRLVGKISDVVDESDQEGMRIVFEVARGCDPQEALEVLLTNTELRTTLSCNNLALNVDDDGNMYPEILPLKDMLVAFIKHRLVVITRRTQFDKDKAEKRLHIVEGLLLALAKIEEVIAIIKKSRDGDTAKVNLIKLLKIDEGQAQAILDMQLRRLASLEVHKLEDEKKELLARIKELNEILNSEEKRLGVMITETKEINEKFPIPRKTVIVTSENGHKEMITVADLLVPEKTQIVLVTNNGILRTDADAYRDNTQVGKASSRAVDTVIGKLTVDPKASVMLVSSKGRLWMGGVGRLPDKGSFADLGMDKNESLVSISAIDPEAVLTIGTRQGNIKRIKMSHILAARSEGSWGSVIGFENNNLDEVIFAGAASDKAQVMFFTRGNAGTGSDARALRFEVSAVNPQATPSAKGVAAIKIADGDFVLGGTVFEPEAMTNAFVVLVTEKGFAKKVRLSEFPVQGRAGQGVMTLKQHPLSGLPVAITLVDPKDFVDLISEKGKKLRIPVKDLLETQRAGKGENIANKFDGLFGDEQIIAIARVETPAEKIIEDNTSNGAKPAGRVRAKPAGISGNAATKAPSPAPKVQKPVEPHSATPGVEQKPKRGQKTNPNQPSLIDVPPKNGRSTK